MAEMIRDFWAGMPLGLYLILILSIGLMVASFIVPPLGYISPTVLQGTAIILGFTWLLYVTVHTPDFVEKGAKIKATYGNASIEIGRKKHELQLPEEQLQEEEDKDDERL